MGNNGILVDSSILIDFLRKKNKENTYLWKLKEIYNNIILSSISVFELYAGATNNDKKNDVRSLLKWMEVIDFNEEIGELAGRYYIILKKENNIIDYRDLFIGTTAVFYDFEIATLNSNHFRKIPNIRLIKMSKIE